MNGRSSLLFVVLLTCIREYHAYDPPEVTVEPLYPKGLRMSIPDEHGITLVAFHVKFNDDFYGLEAGHIARDILKIRNGRWVYEDHDTKLKRDDIIYFWVHVVYQGLGYNKVDQSHRVVEFFNYDGTRHITTTTEVTCTTKSATWIFDGKGGRQQACPRQLIFEDNFDSIDKTKWNTEKFYADVLNYEFVIYMTDDVTDISDGRARIKPILVDEKFGKDFTLHGNLSLIDCTGVPGTDECQRVGTGFYILPPVISGRLNTKEKFEFLFGRIEIRARLPRGDWIYPIIALHSAENKEYEMYRQIRIASSVGNEELVTNNNENIGGRILYAGGITTNINESDTLEINRAKLPKRVSTKPWSEEAHIYEIEWKSGLITTKVDGVQYGEQIVDVSFGKQSYLTLGVGVAGIQEFADYTTSNGYTKPWRNVESKGKYNFYNAQDKWYPTWGPKTSMEIDYVKIWAL